MREYILITLEKTPLLGLSHFRGERIRLTDKIILFNNKKPVNDITNNFKKIIGKIKCKGLSGENFKYSIKYIKPSDHFFYDELISPKKSIFNINRIYCIVQFTDNKFFPIPFYAPHVNNLLYDKFYRFENVFYFPTKVTFNKNINYYNNSDLNPNKIIDISNERYKAFFKNVFKICISSYLLDHTMQKSRFITLLSSKRPSVIKYASCFLLVPIILIPEETRSFFIQCVLPDAIKSFLKSSSILFYFANTDVFYKLLGAGLIYFVAWYFFPLLSMKRLSYTEKFFSDLINHRVDKNLFVSGIGKFVLSGFNSRLNDNFIKSVFDQINTNSQDKMKLIAISIAIIALMVRILS
jgi:hypothetical protein